MKRVFGFIFSLAVIFVLVWILKDIDFYEVYLLLTYAKPVWIGLAVLSTFLTFVVWNFRWMYIFRPVFKGKFWFLLNVLFAGAFFNTVTPGAGVGGEPFKAYFLAKKYKKPKTKVLGYVLGDSFFKMMSFSVFVVFSILFVITFVNISSSLKLILEGILIFVLLAVGLTIYFISGSPNLRIGGLFRRLHRFRFLKNRFDSEGKFVHFVNRKIKFFQKVFAESVKKKENLVVGFLLAFVFWIFNFLTAYFLFLAFGKSVNFLSVVIVFTLGNIIGGLSPVPGGIGVVEGSMTLLYSAMGIPVSLALLAAFLHRMIYYFFSLVVGGWSLVHLRKIMGVSEGGFSS